ncbi:MAG: response regulator [Gemmatimonadales bacterium]
MPVPNIPGPPSILVIDDEPTVRRTARLFLSEWGFRVLEAEHGEEAMAELAMVPSGVQLVIVDIVLPMEDGVKVAQRILERWPGQPILYMSAHPAEVLFRHGLSNQHPAFLAKPFTREELLQKVQAALETGSGSRIRQ